MSINVDIQYFGSVYFYLNLIDASLCRFYARKPYAKGLHLNRTVLYGPNGLLPISVPLAGGRNTKACLSDVSVAEDVTWRRIHWRTIHDAYRKAPWFDCYGPEIEQLSTTSEKSLLALNLVTFRWVLKKLNWMKDILAVDHPSENEPSGILPYESLSKPIREVPENYPTYMQVFMERSGFIGNLSIIDLLMNEGPAAGSYLRRLKDFMNGQQKTTSVTKVG